ncbi:hypothetical protein TELCIR_02227 [Teladorsagia circumcincta]|uniref:Uncharacterized protein n=1 Tax=Teladorsagia circumcincta TaxID=45464 RepID=A0A2G9UZR8_TELCI|nr:hypothetical protein TELCIR_02227 [Teladorsagia circumcincta]
MSRKITAPKRYIRALVTRFVSRKPIQVPVVPIKDGNSDTNNQHELNTVLVHPVDLFKYHQLSEDIKQIAEDLEKQSSDKKG